MYTEYIDITGPPNEPQIAKFSLQIQTSTTNVNLNVVQMWYLNIYISTAIKLHLGVDLGVHWKQNIVAPLVRMSTTQTRTWVKTIK